MTEAILLATASRQRAGRCWHSHVGPPFFSELSGSDRCLLPRIVAHAGRQPTASNSAAADGSRHESFLRPTLGGALTHCRISLGTMCGVSVTALALGRLVTCRLSSLLANHPVVRGALLGALPASSRTVPGLRAGAVSHPLLLSLVQLSLAWFRIWLSAFGFPPRCAGSVLYPCCVLRQHITGPAGGSLLSGAARASA